MLAFVVPAHFLMISVSIIPLACVFLIFSISVFMYWVVSFICLIAFSLFSLRDLLIFFVYLFLHFFEKISYFFKSFQHSLEVIFRSFSSALSIFGCSSLGVVGSLGFTGVVLFFVVFCPFLLIFSSNMCGWGCLRFCLLIFCVSVNPKLRWLFFIV